MKRPEFASTAIEALKKGEEIEIQNVYISVVIEAIEPGEEIAFVVEPNKITKGWSVLKKVDTK